MTQEEYRCKLKAANCNADMNAAFQIMADYIAELEAKVPVWHPYPAEPPEGRGDSYNVAMIKYLHPVDEETGEETDIVIEVPFVRQGWWYWPGRQFQDSTGTPLNSVYAWTELPAPPKEAK